MKILLADDHALFRDGMHFVLKRLDDKAQILDVGNFHDAIKAAGNHPDIDLVLLDLNMPGSDGTDSIKLFHSSFPEMSVVVVSGTDQREDIQKVLNNGASGFISKMSSGKEMVEALRLVLAGGVYLPPPLLQHALGQIKEDKRSRRTNEFGFTGRQMEVLKHIALGLSNRDIGTTIGMAEGTVKIHVSAIFNLLRVNKRMDAVSEAQRLGTVSGR